MIILASLLLRTEFSLLCDSPAKINERDTPGSDASLINHDRVENHCKGSSTLDSR